MVYIGVLWNTVNDFKDEIVKDINEVEEILCYFDYNLNENYENFVRKMYESDGIAKWKVDSKLETMNLSTNKNIRIVFIKINDTTLEFNSKKNKFVITHVENLKNGIRTKYSQLIPNYYFDNVFHMTDNEEELSNTLIVLQEWFPNVCEEYHHLISEQDNTLKKKRLIK